jgi:hypothetical protein
MTLSNRFNFHAKTECAIKVGTRKKSDGSIIHVRAGKIMSRFWADGSRDKYGAEVRNNRLKELALAENNRRQEAARVSHTIVRKGANPGPI